jgi:uncharacterized protein
MAGMNKDRSVIDSAEPAGIAPGAWRRPEKITLIGLLAFACTTIVLLLAVMYVVPTYGLGRIHPKLPMLLGVLTAVLAMGVVFASGILITVTLLGHDVPFSRQVRGIAVKSLLPVLILAGKLVGLKREQVQHAFVAVNNDLVLAHCKNGRRPRRILLLMPHCIQDSDCSVKVTHNVDNCKRCGKCAIKDLLQLSEKYHVDLAVATGGTIARRIVVEKRPDLIIAVACERDLTSGIQDTTPLPVYGIFNHRPFGPCLNTQVPVAHVEAVLADLLSGQTSDS